MPIQMNARHLFLIEDGLEENPELVSLFLGDQVVRAPRKRILLSVNTHYSEIEGAYQLPWEIVLSIARSMGALGDDTRLRWPMPPKLRLIDRILRILRIHREAESVPELPSTLQELLALGHAPLGEGADCFDELSVSKSGALVGIMITRRFDLIGGNPWYLHDNLVFAVTVEEKGYRLFRDTLVGESRESGFQIETISADAAPH